MRRSGVRTLAGWFRLIEVKDGAGPRCSMLRHRCPQGPVTIFERTLPMTQFDRRQPPLSPILLAGMILRPLPAAMLRPWTQFAMAVMRRRHAVVFNRLVDLGDTVFLIDPVDLPFVFRLRLGGSAPSLIPMKRQEPIGPAPAVAIRGPLLVLIELLEGRGDADALFFSRNVVVEGDMEAAVALRNALEQDDINILRDLLAVAGPFAKLGERAATAAIRLYERAADDLETARSAALGPVAARCDQQAAKLRAVEEALDARSNRKGTVTGRVRGPS